MSILVEILNDEYERLKSLFEEYNNQVKFLPLGSISIKNIKGKNYCYLAYRERDKVKYKYIGKEESIKVKELKDKIEKRRNIQIKIKEIKSEINEIKKVIDGKKI